MAKPLVVIAEDEWTQADIYRIVLERAGFAVMTAKTAQAALRLLRFLRPNLVILDLHLPDMPGDQLVQQLRLLPHLAHTPLIAATAYPRSVEPFRDLFDLVLIKPVSPTQLRELAQRLSA